MGTDRDQDLKDVQNLKDGETCYVFFFEEGGGEVTKVNNMLILFEIPQYGGIPQYAASYHERDAGELVSEVYTWT